MDLPPIQEAAAIVCAWLEAGTDGATTSVSLFRGENGRLLCLASGHDKHGAKVGQLCELDESADLTCQMAATVLSWQEEHENCVLS